MEDMESLYFTRQILTYMGNKRKFLNKLDDIIGEIKIKLKKKDISIAEGFSGSGIVSRLLKNRVMGSDSENLKTLYVNDIAGYAKTINECYLTSNLDLTTDDCETLILHMKNINKFINNDSVNPEPFIAKYWAPKDDGDIKENERTYYSHENAVRIDKIRYYINKYVEEQYKCFFLAPLLVQCSIHNNTNGQFSAYYKNKAKTKGKFGGENGVDLQRIKGKIEPTMPILTSHKAKVIISQENTLDWIKKIPKVDLVYYDPPYNKHPYNIYYFLLDIINNWDTKQEIPNSYRGQPKNWEKSPYCSFKNAKTEFENLIKNTKSNFILLSYNNKGIIPLNEVDEILMKYGILTKIPVTHSVYNKYIGIAAKKRKKKEEKISEFLWLLDCRKN